MNRYFIAIALLPLALCAPSWASAEAETSPFLHRQLKSGGLNREYYVFSPPHKGPVPQPLVLAFHGAKGTALGFEKIASLRGVAEREGFVLVYPEGLEKRWNDGRPENAARTDDVGFVDSLLPALEKEFHTDPRRTYALGFSNGGLFSYRLACERAGRFAAIAAVGANLALPLASRCKPEVPISVSVIAGEKDPFMPYLGGRVTGPFGGGNLGTVLSTQETLSFWTKQNRCFNEPKRKKGRTGKDGTSTDKEIFSGCAQDTAVVLHLVREAGHTWPGGSQYLRPWIIGKTTQEFNASDAVWTFFSAHHR